MKIRYNDLQRHHEPLQERFATALASVSRSGQYILGAEVEKFEREFADYCETTHCVAVANGTDALWLALEALGIGKGDEVITVANSYIATTEAILRSGARPVFVDVNPGSGQIDSAAALAAITPRTTAILPVHLYGQPAPMAELRRLAESHGLALIEDAAQAHGAREDGIRVGRDLGCFSFYPGKNLGALGDAGAVTTSSDILAEKLRQLRNHGQDQLSNHRIQGWNSRMDEMQAAILRIKLPFLDGWNEQRRSHFKSYCERIEGLKAGMIFETDSKSEHAHHVFPVLVEGREKLAQFLQRRGIETRCHYPTPIHLQPSCAALGYRRGDLPVTEALSSKSLSLPLFPEMTFTEVDKVAFALSQFLSFHTLPG